MLNTILFFFYCCCVYRHHKSKNNNQFIPYTQNRCKKKFEESSNCCLLLVSNVYLLSAFSSLCPRMLRALSLVSAIFTQFMWTTLKLITTFCRDLLPAAWTLLGGSLFCTLTSFRLCAQESKVQDKCIHTFACKMHAHVTVKIVQSAVFIVAHVCMQEFLSCAIKASLSPGQCVNLPNFNEYQCNNKYL